MELGIQIQQAGQSRDFVLRLGVQAVAVGKRVKRARVDCIQSCLYAVDECDEARRPRWIEERPFGRTQFEIAVQHLGIRHGADISEVRLRGGVNRLDDLCASFSHLSEVTCDFVKQSACACCGVINFVDISTQLAAPRRHAIHGATSGNPVVSADGVDQHLFHGLGGGRLLCCHRSCADDDSIYRHRRQSAPCRPRAHQIITGLLWLADTAANSKHHISLADLCVGVN